MTMQTCWIPAGVDLRAVVGADRRRQGAAARLLNLIHKLSDCRRAAQRCPDGYVRLWSKLLTKEIASKGLFYGEGDHPGLRDQLRDAGLITWNGHYSTTQHYAKGYRLEEPFASGEWVSIQVRRKRPIQAMDELGPADRYLKECLRHVQFAVPEDVIAHLRNTTQTHDGRTFHPLRAQAEAVLEWQERVENYRDHSIKWQTGRRHERRYTTLTQLMSKLRGYAKVNGMPLWLIDFTNLHPLLTGILATRTYGDTSPTNTQPHNHHAHPTPHTPYPTPLHMCLESYSSELHQWLERCQPQHDHEPDVYLSLLPDLRDSTLLAGYNERFRVTEPVLKRKHVKKALLTYFNSRPSHYRLPFLRPVDQLLERQFPELHAYIREAKREDHRELFYRMVDLETHFIFDQIVPALIQESPGIWLATIHDALVTTADQVELVKAVIRRVFAERGLRPHLKDEACPCFDLTSIQVPRQNSR